MYLKGRAVIEWNASGDTAGILVYIPLEGWKEGGLVEIARRRRGHGSDYISLGASI